MLTRHVRYPPTFMVTRPVWVARDLLKNHRSGFADAYLQGLDGIEIGASAANDFRLRTVNVDMAENEIYRQEQLRLCGRVIPVDVVIPADDALPFDDGSYDFVLASHVIEHMPDPVGTLRDWARIARRYVFLVVPHRDRTFDRNRPLTPVDELLERHANGFRSQEDRHWSVWTAESFLELCRAIGLSVREYQDPDDKIGNGFAVLIDVSGESNGEAPRKRDPPAPHWRLVHRIAFSRS